MKKSIQKTSKSIAILLLIALSFASCAQKSETTSTLTSNRQDIVNPSQDIHEAIISNNVKVVEQHIKEGSDINKVESMSGSSPLITAVTFNRPKIVSALIKAKANLSIQNNDGSTALHTAAFFGRTEIVEMLLAAGADKTLKNNFGATPRETILGDFNQMKPIYEMLINQLEPMGFTLNLEEVEKARPIIANLLEQ